MNILLLQLLVFLASFLIFQIELILGKVILPSFGGGYLVWGISVVFYQGLLFLGYYYIHVLDRLTSFEKYRKWQIAALVLSLFLLPLNINRLQTPSYGLPTPVEIVALLALTIGILFFLLASLSVYTQIQLAHSEVPERKNPYILFAASNLGAFASLLTYPFLVEPFFDTTTQLLHWQVMYAVLVALFLAVQFRIPRAPGAETEPATPKPIDRNLRLQWLLLSAAPSALFLSITNELTFNIAPVPLLWILPLALYLLTFVLAFKKKPFCPQGLRDRFYLLINLGVFLFFFNLMDNSILEFLVMILLRFHLPWYTGAVLVEPVILLTICFGFCLVCHFQLHAKKPQDPSQLTGFYLTLSIGGFLGGVLINWLVPLVFDTTVETLICFLLAVWAFSLEPEKKSLAPARFLLLIGTILTVMGGWLWLAQGSPPQLKSLIGVAGGLALFVLLFIVQERHRQMAYVLALLVAVIPFMDMFQSGRTVLMKERNYYGIYKVFDSQGYRHMMHGSVLHGAQFLDPAMKSEPLTYFHRGSPLGAFMNSNPLNLKRWALVGLGTGSLAAYCRPGDAYDYFELDPLVGEIAENYFSFLKDAEGTVRILYGDARVSMRKLEDASYDSMAVDVFNSGSIPVHLITVDAIREYRRLLKPGGILFFHLSNEFLDLLPVVRANANALGLHALVQYNRKQDPPKKEMTLWAALVEDSQSTALLKERFGWRDLKTRQLAPWTDRYSSLFSVLSN